MALYEIKREQLWRLKRAVKAYIRYLDEVFEEKEIGDEYRKILTSLTPKLSDLA
jgi:hypothetical protein